MKHFYKHFILVLVLSVFIFQGCGDSIREKKVRIGISKEYKCQYYTGWLKRYSDGVQLFNLYPMGIDSALQFLETCDGLLISGGEDVYPGVYGKLKDTPRCGAIDRYRDSLELALIEVALVDNKPIIGICRGEQILNVSFGGTLHIDIPVDFDTTVIHRQKDWKNCFHAVHLKSNSSLYSLSGVETADVTSNHHQGIEILGKGLRISALSDDGLPEAIEWAEPDGKSFLIAVQWHPERMDTLHPLSASIAKKFLLEAIEFKEKR